MRAQSRDAKYVETYLQYVPVAVDLGLDFTGVKAENRFLDRTIAAATAYASLTIVVNGVLKNVVKEERPDGSSNNSFPSGHTATAFCGAELVRHEYGPWWGLGAYAMATTVGVLRVTHERHWVWDAAAGAGIGVLCANVGYWSLPGLKKLFKKKEKVPQVAFYPSYQTSVNAVSGSLTITF